jgi:hypothetical protein
MRVRFAILICVLVLAALAVFWLVRRAGRDGTSAPVESAAETSATDAAKKPLTDDRGPTNVYAHNLMLRKGPDFRVYVR